MKVASPLVSVCAVTAGIMACGPETIAKSTSWPTIGLPRSSCTVAVTVCWIPTMLVADIGAKHARSSMQKVGDIDARMLKLNSAIIKTMKCLFEINTVTFPIFCFLVRSFA